MKKFFSHFDLILTILMVGSGVVALSSPYVDPSKNWLYAFFALLFPLIYGLNFLAFIYWFIRLLFNSKKHRLAIVLPVIILVLGWISPARIYQFHSFAEASKEQKTLRLMTYNVHGLVNVRKNNLDISFQKFLDKNKPEIVFAQECSRTTTQKIANLLSYHYTHNQTKKAIGTAIISKYPILDFGQNPFYKSGNSYTWADIKVHGKTMRFFSLHLQSNAISTQAFKLKEEGADFKSKKTWWRLRRILALYRMTAKQRTEQARAVRQLASTSPYPVFYSGDFNDPPLSNSYHILSENKTDSFIERGNGTGTTYKGLTPALRIDYILVPKQFKVLSHRIPDVDYSDHLPVLVEVAWLD